MLTSQARVYAFFYADFQWLVSPVIINRHYVPVIVFDQINPCYGPQGI